MLWNNVILCKKVQNIIGGGGKCAGISHSGYGCLRSAPQFAGTGFAWLLWYLESLQFTSAFGHRKR